jgi:hypothetical protein
MGTNAVAFTPKPGVRMTSLLRWTRLSLCALAAVLAAGGAARAQAPAATLQVTVTGPDGERVPGAVVSLAGRSGGRTDDAGMLRMAGVPAGVPTELRVTRIGFLARRMDVTVPAGAILELEVPLVAEPVLVPVMSVSTRWDARLAVRQFLERAEHGAPGGRILDKSQIDRRRRTSDLLADIPWLRDWVNGGGPDSRRGSPVCRPAFFVDGVYDPHLGGTYGIGFLGDVDALYPPGDLEGIEAYPVAQAPAQFATPNGACGVVLLWTRDAESELPIIRKLRHPVHRPSPPAARP